MGTKRTSLGPKNARRRYAAGQLSSDSDADKDPIPNNNTSSSRVGAQNVESSSRSADAKNPPNSKQKRDGGDPDEFERERIKMAMYRERIASMSSILQGPGKRAGSSVPAKRKEEKVEVSRDLRSSFIVLGLMSPRVCPWVNKSKVPRNPRS